MQPINPPRGTYDALPEKARRLRHIETTAWDIFQQYGFGEIRTPMFEFTEVFTRNVGETTDVVTKETYTFQDRGGESLTLRPEGTAAVVRAYYSNKLKHSLPLKVAYIGAPMFRYERPQKGRFRQHHQLGVEVFGITSPHADVEVIAMGVRLLQDLGLKDLYVKLNSMGRGDDRVAYRQALVDYFTPHKGQLSAESQERLAKNPLRILDTKDENDQKLIPDAPKFSDYLSDESRAFYDTVKGGLDALGIAYEEDPLVVRGFDYYTHTVFEIHSAALGAQSQVLAGGRYDGLVANMGNEDVAGVGFGCGLERLELLLAELEAEKPPVCFVVEDDACRQQAMVLAEALRRQGQRVHVPLDPASFKSQFKTADKKGAQVVYVLGSQELEKSVVLRKDMTTGEQAEVVFTDIISA